MCGFQRDPQDQIVGDQTVLVAFCTLDEGSEVADQTTGVRGPAAHQIRSPINKGIGDQGGL